MSDPGGLRRFNALPPGDAEHRLLACCGSPAWARSVAAGRPYSGRDALHAACEAAFAALSWEDVTRALSRHPRIGDRPEGPGREPAWSRDEQAGALDAGRRVADELREGNVRYEKRFGHVFLICATGLSAGQMLEALTRRLGNDPATERHIVREELLKIARLRLDKLLEGP